MVFLINKNKLLSSKDLSLIKMEDKLDFSNLELENNMPILDKDFFIDYDLLLTEDKEELDKAPALPDIDTLNSTHLFNRASIIRQPYNTEEIEDSYELDIDLYNTTLSGFKDTREKVYIKPQSYWKTPEKFYGVKYPVKVLCFNDSTNKYFSDTIVSWSKYDYKGYVMNLTFTVKGMKSKITLKPSTEVLTNSGYVKAKDITGEDTLYNKLESFIVTSNTKKEFKGDMYMYETSTKDFGVVVKADSQYLVVK